MGIIKKQSIAGTILAYLGVLLGFITTAILYPEALSKAEIGLLRLLVSVSVLFAQFSGLGFNAVTVRNFPYFRNLKEKSPRLLQTSSTYKPAWLFFAGIDCIFFAIKPWLVSQNIENLIYS